MTGSIDKQILIEKSSFISRNSTFFYKNLANIDILDSLESILLNPAPLSQCSSYEELVEEIKKSKVKNINEMSYSYSFEVLFAIVNSVRRKNITTSTNQIEILRQYVKYITNESCGKMYYSSQNVINLNKENADDIIKTDKQYVKERRNRH